MAKLILVRHGETNKNINNRLHASDDPESLNDRGIKQIEETAQKLKSFLPIKIFTSKENRAIESTKIISNFLQIPFKKIDGMQERNWGVFTGKPWEEVKMVLDPMTLEERYNYEPSGGESWETFETRLISAIKKIIENNPETNIVVVTHGGAVRALMPFLLGVPKEESFNHYPKNSSLTVFDFNGESFTKVLIDDVNHLRQLLP